MITTTLVQSKHLLELGLDPKTADMWWSNRFVYWNTTPMIGVDTEQNQLYTFKWCEEDIPSWSLSALLEVMRKLSVTITLQVIGNFTFLRIKDNGFMWQKDIHVKNPMDAVYGGMLWLLEQGLLRKEDKK